MKNTLLRSYAHGEVHDLADVPFTVWTNSRFTDRPPLDELGMKWAAAANYWGAWTKDLNEPGAVLDEDRLILWARSLDPSSIIYFDDIPWNRIHGNEPSADAVRRRICEILHDMAIPFGIYSKLPRGGWYGAQVFHSDPAFADYFKDKGWFERWQADNRAMTPWSHLVDLVLPSLYVSTQQGFIDFEWVTHFARETIREARQYGKPVIPVIWPRLHITKGPSLPFIEHPYLYDELWLALLQTVREFADGVVLWCGAKIPWAEFAETEHWQMMCDVFGIGKE
jgi:hypothetical protein